MQNLTKALDAVPKGLLYSLFASKCPFFEVPGLLPQISAAQT